ncbi:hypothetical protein WJX81_000453 [Elliptochloris bilobata]|uniref:Exostosin GT47 domain-containing protein n=1 Tax=Elliptochloris bilobata TaxID=381761 RepID=A0AAW1QC51_9CHLO
MGQALPTYWHDQQYDYDVKLHEHFLRSRLRTRDPAAATLFFVPVYLGRLFNWYWQRPQCDEEDAPRPPMCREEQVTDFWGQLWLGAGNATADAVRAAMAHVRRLPHWNRTNGADHFTVFSYDRGRCEMAASLTAEELGDSFAIQSYGDLAARSVPSTPTWVREESFNGSGYNWGGPNGWHCVRPDADIIVPMYAPYTRADLVSPFAAPRNISALLRFEVVPGDGKYLIANHGHRLRHELLKSWAAAPLPGSEVGMQDLARTEVDMRSAIFCVCPPGSTQDSTRVWRALTLGCIPVTFFRATELPFARRLGLDYSQFVVNVQPDDYRGLQARLAALLGKPEQVRALQEGVRRHQVRFLWDPALPSGVYANIEAELAMRARALTKGTLLTAV